MTRPRTASLPAMALVLASIATALLTPGTARAAEASRNIRFTASDGVSLQATVSGQPPLAPRPVIVEFSPYGRNTATLDPGPAYNFLLVQIRGTGDSDGRFDGLGHRTQRDVVQVLRWACDQPWSDGRLGLNGFSASAITIYNSLHLKLPCVEGAVLKSGTFELYRDLLWPGGISNFIPGAGVMALIGLPAAVQGFDRLQRDPASGAEILAGLVETGLTGFLHPRLDSWWRERGFRGDVNDLPILMIDGFYDVESRGAFQAFQALRDDGAHLMVIGAHDGAPVGTDAGVGEVRAWLDRYVRGEPNGVESHPHVQLWLADGDREDLLAGRFVRYDGSDWPIPGTSWESLRLDPRRSGTALSLNDGSLTLGRPAAQRKQTYPALASMPNNTDPYNTAIVGPEGANQLATAFPILTQTNLSEPLSLTYTSERLATDVFSAGPASLNVRLSSTAPETGIWAVIADVAPDGSAHPVASGRLLNAYPGIVRDRSLVRDGEIVQPYGVYSRKDPARPGAERLYRVELWPIGNRFRAGHRIRLEITGTSAASALGLPGLNTVRAGAGSGARLLLPVLPGSDLRAALP